MKRFTLLFITLLSVLGLHAIEVPTGIISVGNNATELEVGKWYCLYNNGTKRFIKENNANALNQVAASPTNQDAENVLGYLVTLEAVDGGKYYIKTGLNNYYKSPSSSARGTGASVTSSWAVTIAPISGTTGHFTIASSTYKLTAPTDFSDPKGGTQSTANSIGDWSFREISVTSADDLGGRDLYNYQIKQLPTFIRLYNRRASTSYLTLTDDGVRGAQKTDALNCVWYMQKNGEGYSLRSAYNGKFLGEGFANPSSSAYTLYIQFSPNNTGNEAFINLSQKAEMGDKCMNLKNDGVNLTTWSADAGSDWAIELVKDVDMETVRESINSSKGYAKTIEDGKYYRILSVPYGRSMAENNNVVTGLPTDPTNFSQLWKVTKTGIALTMQNVFTSKYIQNNTGTSQPFQTGDTPRSFYTKSVGDPWEYTWYITNTPDANWGMHCASSQGYNVVYWSECEANKWAFVEIDVTDEEIANAQSGYKVYQDLLDNMTTYQTTLDYLFADKACTELKDGIKDLTDEQMLAITDVAALPEAIQQMILKVKNDSWQYKTTKSGVTDSYEKFFRVAPYRVYSHYQKMSWREYTGQSNSYGKLSGPTSIVINSGEIAYIYVDADPKAECTLQVEVVSTDGVPGNHQTGTCYDLHQGLNVIQATNQSLLYIFHQLDNPDKYLADYPDIKIHIEGGTLQGYFDLTRGMKNQDWKNMNELGMMQHSSCPVINLKSNNLVFAMHTQLVKDAIKEAHKQAGDEMEDVEFLLHLWNTIPVNQEKYQGLEEFEGRFNNIWNVFSVDYNYMFASTYGTYYNENTLSGCMNYYTSSRFNGDGSEGGPMWGPHHEIGHNHQETVCVVGTMESSNNMFSNIGTHEGGICDTRYAAPQYNFDEYLANGKEWNDRPIEYSCRMYTQLYLYFHAAKNDERFLQKLFQELRKDPIIKRQGWTTTTTADGETKSGYDVKGSQDYLHFAKKCCDVAQADLSEFFESYGFFVPENKHYVGDYADYVVTTTQAEIDEAKAYMKKYPKKLGNIMFITDHQTRKMANPDNIYGYVPTRSDGKKHQAAGSGEWATKYYAYGCCNGGDYESYDGHTQYDVEGDYYTISGNTITFKGKGYLGHKVYDGEGNLIWAVNKASHTIPDVIRNLFPDKDANSKLVVVSAQQNMTDVPCPYYKSGKAKVYKTQVNFADGTSKLWYATDNIDKYLPQNAIAVINTAGAPEALTNSCNVVNTDGTAQSIVINGDVPAYIPSAIQAQSVVFTKSGEGCQALCLPFAVSNAKTIVNNACTDAEVVEAGQPVIVDGAVEYALTNVALTTGAYTTTAQGYVIAADGKSTVAATDITPFTYVWESPFDIADAITAAAANTGNHNIYDLQGRRHNNIAQPGLYIIDGRRVMVK